jgi:crossover junction endodeoxyribonuclease RuvC
MKFDPHMKVMGIDPSVTATGIVILMPSGTPTPDLMIEREISFKKLTGVDRQASILVEIMTCIHTHKPSKIVIEGYSLNMKHSSSVIPLVELGGQLRLMFRLDKLDWFDPRATELKQFVSGKGSSKKEEVMMHVLKRWGHTSMTNNTADAYVLAAMGLAQVGQLPGITKEQLAIAGKMTLRSN